MKINTFVWINKIEKENIRAITANLPKFEISVAKEQLNEIVFTE